MQGLASYMLGKHSTGLPRSLILTPALTPPFYVGVGRHLYVMAYVYIEVKETTLW